MKSKITILIIIHMLFGISVCDSLKLDDELNQILSEIEAKRGNNNNNFSKNDKIARVIEDPRQSDRNVIHLNGGNSLQPIPEGTLSSNNNKELFEPPKITDCTDECVPFYQCNNGSIVTSGENLIDMR